ncbi:MAG: hypothetical protein WC117_00360 [Sphaerochaetaceae bacterium]
MELTLYKRKASGPYLEATLEELYAEEDAVLLIEDESQRPLFEGLQLLMGSEITIYLHVEGAYTNSWFYGAPIVFFASDPTDILNKLDTL